jgi:hypothetical protein
MPVIKLDLSRLDKEEQAKGLIGKLSEFLDRSNREILTAVEHYGEGKAKQEMTGWANAASEMKTAIPPDSLSLELDLSKLSGGQQCDVIKTMIHFLAKSQRWIREDAQIWQDGDEEKAEMLAFADAAKDLELSIRTQAKEQGVIFYT